MCSNKLAVVLLLLAISGCGSWTDDLAPSGKDKRPADELTSASTSTTETIGSAVGQKAPDFTLSDSLGNSVTLSTIAPSAGGVVLYFTMWCPTCDTHMSYIRDYVMPSYPKVVFYAVDYVSGSVADARSAEVSNGYVGSGFTVLADTAQTVLTAYDGTMGTTVVIDKNGIVKMNEDLKNGTTLQTVLGKLP